MSRGRAEQDQPDEQAERQRQRYRELLEELRTIIPGVQVLFAFLLTAPFAARFPELDRLGKIVFVVSLMAVTAATFSMVAPIAYHRVVDRRDRAARLRFGVATALAGLFLLAVSMICTIFVVVRFLFSSTALAIVLATIAALVCAMLWALLPLSLERAKSS